MDEVFYTPEQLSARLGIPVPTLARWRFLRTGPAYIKFGARVRYADKDIERWLQESRRLDTCGAESAHG